MRRTIRLLTAATALLLLATPSAGAQSLAPLPDFDTRDATPGDLAPEPAQTAELRSLDAAAQFDADFGTPASLVALEGRLSPPTGDGARQVVRDFLADHRDLYRLDASGLEALADGGAYRTEHNGVTHVTLQQSDGGRDVFGSILTFAVDEHGRLVTQAGALAPGADAAAQPALTAVQAVEAAAVAVGATASAAPGVLASGGGPRERTTLENVYASGLADPRPVEAELVTFPMPDGLPARLGWRMTLEVSDAADYELVVDAADGELLFRRNAYENAPEGNVFTSQNPTTTQSIVPFTGWVADRTTEGNNVNAYEDLNASNAVGYRPQTPASGDPNYQHFNYTFTDAYQTSGGTDVATDRDPVITQLFYWVNFSHDYLYGLGFDEASGNFQRDNFGRGGAGNDPVLAEAHNGFGDGSQMLCQNSAMPPANILCRNNANFNTPADGTSPRLQVYLGATPFPFRQSEMEGDTIVHEYMHGVSNRLVGDGTLGTGVQTRGMGEGWGDFIATSVFNDPVIFEYSGGGDGTVSGFRRVRYDTSTQQYSDLCQPGGCEVHNDGEIWATALWAMRAALIGRYGFAGGKGQSEQLVIDGMKNTGTTPTFLTARDAILAADQTNNGGTNACLIWGVFAAREMGFSAASSSDQMTVTPATDGPSTCTPTASAGGPYTTDEGTDETLDASGSTNPGDGPLTYAWDLDGDTQYDDATGASPSFTTVGRDGSFPVAVQVTNANGFSDTASSSVTVDNVAPVVGAIATTGPKPENQAISVSGTITDAGWEDTLSATIDYDDGAGPQPLTGSEEHVRPDGSISYDVSHVYGDDGTFTIEVCAADDDVSDQCATTPVTISNSDPTAAIGESGATNVNGTPVLIAHAGQPVAFSGRSTDPGSDDLRLEWNWDDGPPLVDASTVFLVNPPLPDPDPSPSVQPRDVTDNRSHSFGQACMYEVGFVAADDDGGSASDAITVMIAGNSALGRPTGWWHHQYKQKGRIDFDTATLTCYLRIAGFVSNVFHEARDASTFPKAAVVLQGQGGKRAQLERDLLTAWLNFANGAVEWGELVDTDKKGGPDTAFATAMKNAEAVSLNPAATAKQLDAQRNIVHHINTKI